MSNKKLAVEKKAIQTMIKKAKAEQQKSPQQQKTTKKLGSSQQQPLQRVAKQYKNLDEIKRKVDAELKSEDSQVPEPPYQFETHVKRQLFYVRVQLHKILHQFINLDETTDKKFVVDTTKYTKKVRLEFPFPDGMVVDSQKAEYEFESGLLRCTFPIKQLPASEASRVKGIIQSQKNSRKLRFERQLDQTTGMETRSRTRTLDLANSSASSLLKRKVKKQQQREEAESNDDDDDDEGGAATSQDAAAGQRRKKQPLTSKEEREMVLKIASNNTKKPASSASSGKYVSDADGAKKIAAQVSDQASKSIKQNISNLKKLAAVHHQKKQKSASASQHKKDVLNRSFLDVMKQKQVAIRQQIENSKPVEKKTKSENSKNVSFAA